MPKSKIFLLLVLALLLILPSLSACARTPDLDSTIHDATGGFRFGLASWEFKTLSGELTGTSSGRRSPSDNLTSEENLIERRVAEAFAAQGIFNPLDRFFSLKIGFPPVYIYLGRPPHLLVVSPRDSIENIREVNLLPDMDEKDMEAIEAKIDAFGYSALVVDLGGLSTFPSYIADDAGIRFILDTAAHEWMHLYLTFTPLGFLNLLDKTGIRRDYDINTMNETVADIVGHEIGESVYERYYAPPPSDNTTPEGPARGFDFNKAMREIRLAVDDYLAGGQIDEAEKFMEEQRRYLAANGYYIRKLNQAYFAFYGSYADSPASVSPIGADLAQLREQSASLKAFLDTVVTMTSRRDLEKSVK
jgi:hypothetical protein